MTFIESTEGELEVCQPEQVNCQHFNEENCHDFDNVVIQKKVWVKKQPYLKRKSIRVDLALKASEKKREKKIFKNEINENVEKVPQIQEPTVTKCESSEMKQMEFIQALLREKKQLESELMMMKGRVAQLEEMYYESRNFYKEQLKKAYSKGEEQVTCKKSHSTECIPKKIFLKKSVNKKKTADCLEECPKCHKHFKNKYMKYHDRVCGNIKLKYILSERDLLQLETAKLNMQSENLKYEFDWRKRRVEFKKQVEQAKLRKNFMILYKRK
ncbi:predicted protein [Naegleria gruberi]|uniref:Predicted protein n=1 Tax=Naegleria gruberi TaxID=5762 RepID=D2V8W9_NAEGR|nr:uncharacterized protein NAEGRDRAFT_47607 [Naegleria gruberi]EFC46874.1 predicted protein [Naegleria gruberi]|eukprot:XP_002679618.1 predicted protein [Naegleria gruberi strain NEG-M]